MEAEAGQVYLAYRERSLSSHARPRLGPAGAEGHRGSQDAWSSSRRAWARNRTAEVRDLAGAAAEAQATLFVVLVDTSGARRLLQADHGGGRAPEDRERDTSGLYDLAGLSRGVVLQGGRLR